MPHLGYPWTSFWTIHARPARWWGSSATFMAPVGGDRDAPSAVDCSESITARRARCACSSDAAGDTRGAGARPEARASACEAGRAESAMSGPGCPAVPQPTPSLPSAEVAIDGGVVATPGTEVPGPLRAEAEGRRRRIRYDGRAVGMRKL